MNSYTTAMTYSGSASRLTARFGYPALALLSGLVSAWLILLDPVMNTQAITTLREAQAFIPNVKVGVSELQTLGPQIIASLHQLTGLSLFSSAHLVTSGLYVLLCLAFVATVKTLGGNWQVQSWAALLVLIHPLLCEFRSDLSLEPGYWAFTLLALRQLLIYSRQPAWKAQLLWLSCVCLAALFQLEALVVANLAPAILLLALPRRRRLNAGIKLLLPVWALTAALVFSGGLAALATLQGIELPASLADWIALAKSGNQLPAEVAIALPQLAQSPDQGWAVAGGLLGIMLATLARAFTGICLVLLAIAWWQGTQRKWTPPARSLVNAHLGVTLLYLALYAMLGDSTANLIPNLIPNLITTRAVAPAVLLLMLYLPFVLDDMWCRRRPAWKILALAAVLLTASDGLYNRNFEKRHVADAATWLRSNIPPQASVFSNNPYLSYFAQRPGTELANNNPTLAQLLADAPWHEHPFLALYLDGSAFAQWYELRHYPQLEVLKVFRNADRDTVVVLKNSTDHALE